MDLYGIKRAQQRAVQIPYDRTECAAYWYTHVMNVWDAAGGEKCVGFTLRFMAGCYYRIGRYSLMWVSAGFIVCWCVCMRCMHVCMVATLRALAPEFFASRRMWGVGMGAAGLLGETTFLALSADVCTHAWKSAQQLSC